MQTRSTLKCLLHSRERMLTAQSNERKNKCKCKWKMEKNNNTVIVLQIFRSESIVAFYLISFGNRMNLGFKWIFFLVKQVNFLVRRSKVKIFFSKRFGTPTRNGSNHKFEEQRHWIQNNHCILNQRKKIPPFPSSKSKECLQTTYIISQPKSSKIAPWACDEDEPTT